MWQDTQVITPPRRSTDECKRATRRKTSHWKAVDLRAEKETLERVRADDVWTDVFRNAGDDQSRSVTLVEESWPGIDAGTEGSEDEQW